MLKKGFAILAAFVCMLFCFTGCGLNSSGADKNPAEPGETFKGAVSDEYYDSEQAAAKAFLHNELDVTADDFNNSAEFRQVAIFYTEFIKTENSGELSLDEVKDLIALESDKEDLVKAEKISVEFSPRSDSALYADYVGELDESLEQTFILLSYSDGRVKYLTPLPEIDELCTKSYFDSVLDVSQYKNFTVDYKYKEDKIPEDLKIEFHQSYLTKYTENSSCEIPETVELYYDGFTLDDFMERYEWNIFFGEMTLDDVEKLYNRYSESDKPFAAHPRRGWLYWPLLRRWREQ